MLAGSAVSGSREAIVGLQRAFPRLYQRPDAAYLGVDSTRTSLTGLTGEIALQKASGTHWIGSVSAAFTSPGFDANSLGFQPRADDINGGGVVIYQQNTPGRWTRSWNANAYAGLGTNFGGDLTNAFSGVEGDVNFANFWGMHGSATVSPRTVTDRLTRGGVLAMDPAGVELNLSGRSDDRRAVTGYSYLYASANEIGTRSAGTEVGVKARPAPNVELGLYPGVSASHIARQYVTGFADPAATGTFGRRTLFAASDQAEFSMSLRVNWTFTPDLSLQLFARPFVSRGRYAAFAEPTASRQLRFPTIEAAGGTTARADDGTVTIAPGDGGAPYAVAPDFTVRALQGNAVLRWEYRPGSALFVVWQQQREGFDPDGRSPFGRTLGRLGRDPLQNVFLVKLTYWLG